MAASLSLISGKDGGGTLIAGGIQALDLSGTGVGPWSFANILVDGLAGVNRAAVKAASTAPAATDPALVVTTSPNSFDFGAGTSGTKTQRFIVDSSQLSALATAYDVLNNAGGGQKVYFPTDQPVPNKVQAIANGQTSSRVVAAASTNATSLKGSAGNVYQMDVFNVAAYDVFFKFYNKATAPTVGSDTPTWTIPIKAGTGYSVRFPYGKSFATGVAYAMTKLQADSDTTVLVAGDVTGTIDWI